MKRISSDRKDGVANAVRYGNIVPSFFREDGFRPFHISKYMKSKKRPGNLFVKINERMLFFQLHDFIKDKLEPNRVVLGVSFYIIRNS
jgi:hypothetical protein